MVRAKHYIRVIDEENMLDNARHEGDFLLTELKKLAAEFPNVASNPRGRGLMCAMTLRDSETRDKVVSHLADHGVMMLPCGYTSIRVRPSLNVTREDIMFGSDALRVALEACV